MIFLSKPYFVNLVKNIRRNWYGEPNSGSLVRTLKTLLRLLDHITKIRYIRDKTTIY